MLPDIEGKWLGVLSYGTEYGPDIAGKTLSFEIVFVKNPSEEDTFTGVAKDIDGMGYNPTKAHIEGFIEGNLISFTKLYEQQFYFNEEGDSIPDEINNPIQYSGRYNPQLNKFVGEWKIVEYGVDYGGWIETYECTGLWEMTRVNLQAI